MVVKLYADDGRAEPKANEDRPVDLAMLHRFFAAYEEQIVTYGRMLEAIVANAIGFDDSEVRHSRESEVDAAVEAMTKVKVSLRSEEVAAISRFLIELQVEKKGEPVRCKDFVASNACALVELVVIEAADSWRRLRKNGRSGLDERHTKSASEVFYAEVCPQLPRPQELYALVVLEYARARRSLKEEVWKA